jgi:hypothetical protein
MEQHPEYPKITSIFKRDEKTHKFILGEWGLPELEYLQNNQWQFTEKIDGTNVRLGWNPETSQILFMGRTDKASLPTFLLARLQQIFTAEKLRAIFPDAPVTVYGEGFGNRIQKTGNLYIPDGVDLILFDIRIGKWWLQRPDLEDIAGKLGIRIVPIVGQGTLSEAVELIMARTLKSIFGDFPAEGIVLKPLIELRDRAGQRVITKLKHGDFD